MFQRAQRAAARMGPLFAFQTFQMLNTYVVTPLMILTEHLKNIALSYVPSYVSEVLLVTTEHATPQVRPLYRASDYYFSWHRAYATLMYVTDVHQYYVVTVWNSNTVRYETYFLNASHLCRALSIRTIGAWWAMSDFGIVSQLSAYLVSMRKASYGIYELRIGSEYIAEALAPVIRSLELPDNITARALYAYYAYVKKIALPAPEPASFVKPMPSDTESENEGECESDNLSSVSMDTSKTSKSSKSSKSSDTAEVLYETPISHPISLSASASEITPAEPETVPVPAPAAEKTFTPKPVPASVYCVTVINYDLDEWECRDDAPLHAL
jgi:hypothetical protein